MDPFSAFEPYGGQAPPERLTGHLLVASPRLADPNFTRRVVLVLDHGEHGALGVVIDRPGGVAVGELLPQWHSLATAPAELFTGGPVARNALIGLVRLTSRPGASEEELLERSGWRVLVDAERPVGTVDLSSDPVADRRRSSSGPACSPATPAGTRTSSRRRSRRARGTWCRPRRATRSPPILRVCGVGCCGARAAPWPWCRGSPRTRP